MSLARPCYDKTALLKICSACVIAAGHPQIRSVVVVNLVCGNKDFPPAKSQRECRQEMLQVFDLNPQPSGKRRLRHPENRRVA